MFIVVYVKLVKLNMYIYAKVIEVNKCLALKETFWLVDPGILNSNA